MFITFLVLDGFELWGVRLGLVSTVLDLLALLMSGHLFDESGYPEHLVVLDTIL